MMVRDKIHNAKRQAGQGRPTCKFNSGSVPVSPAINVAVSVHGRACAGLCVPSQASPYPIREKRLIKREFERRCFASGGVGHDVGPRNSTSKSSHLTQDSRISERLQVAPSKARTYCVLTSLQTRLDPCSILTMLKCQMRDARCLSA